MKNGNPAVLNVAAGVVLGLFLAVPFAFRQIEHNRNTIVYQPPALPEQIAFAGEPVPMTRWDVQERFDRELLINYHRPGTVLFLLKLSNRYFPIISERLKAAGVPDDFKYLCVAESNLVGGARSRSGAIGFWQFMSGTAPGYGLQVTSEVDFRRDIERSTDAACKYLKNAYQKFGSWTAAAASYNCGMGGYNRQATFQGTTNYYDLVLPEETSRYLFRILTFKHLLQNASSLGFELKDEEKYSAIPFRTITIKASIPNLAAFARENGTTYLMLRQLNPWLRGRTLTVRNGHSYKIKLPVQ
jgi:membrane-bound lytic murein transglycosylase D